MTDVRADEATEPATEPPIEVMTSAGTASSLPSSPAYPAPAPSLLPLAVPREEAGQQFKAWLGSRWFAPNDLKSIAKPETLTPVYVPIWSFTANAVTSYEGKRGDDRTEWRTVTSTDSQGNSQSSREAHTVTDWHRVSGEVTARFQNVVVPASATITAEEKTALMPYDLDNAVPYQAEYVLGCASEQYSVTLPDGWAQAQGLVDKAIEQGVKEDIGGDHQRIRERSTEWTSILFLHLMLPVWVAAYRYRGTSYRVLVNGRSGEVVGDRPHSVVKITLAVLAVVIVVVALVLLVRSQQQAPTQGDVQATAT